MVSAKWWLPEQGLSTRDESLRPGWGWCHGNGQAVARPSCWALVNGATRIYAKCSSMERARCGLTCKTRRLQFGEVDERIGNQNGTQCGDRRHR